MKRPLINEFDRMIMRECPDTFFTQRNELALAGLKLRREIQREFEKSLLYKYIVRL